MSSSEILILGKLFLTFTVLLGLPLWDLYRLRRDRAGRGAGDPGRRRTRGTGRPLPCRD